MSSSRALAPLLVVLLLTACDPDSTPAPVDSGVTTDAGTGTDAGTETDAGTDAGVDAGVDAGTDAGTDAGPGTPLNVTTQTLPDAYVGLAYSANLVATGGKPPYTFSLTGGALPTGLMLSATGLLSGTPVGTASASLTVTARDADGQTDSQPLSLAVREPGAPVFTVGQWNLTYFGDNSRGPEDTVQLNNARDVMRDLRANVWGMVEMSDAADFDNLRSQLPGFSGFLSNNATFVSGAPGPYTAGNQKLGILYDPSLTFQSARLILTDAESLPYFSQRPPLRVDFTTEIQGVETPLTVIVVHMRAESSDPTGPRNQRQEASRRLKEYLDQNLPTQHVFVVGDWNDDVDESITLDPGTGTPLPTPYQNFVSDSERYTFITRALSLAGDDTSIGFENVVDHTLASNEAAARYVEGSARVIYADTWVPDFLNTTSDHRPVVSSYSLSAETGPFIRLKAPQGGTYQAGSVLLVTWTHWAVGSVRIEASTNGGEQWDVVAASVPAAQGSYPWTLPDVDSSTVLVRVVDAANPQRTDTSDAPLTLVRGPARVFINEFLAFEPLLPNGSRSQAYEFIELVNGSPFTVDISGWGVGDNTNPPRYAFPSGSRLAPGKAIVVFGGAAGIPPGSTNAVSSNQNTLGLTNTGTDTVRLRLPDGGVVDQYEYSAPPDGISLYRSPEGDPDAGFVPHPPLPSGQAYSPGLRADGTSF